MQRLLIAAAAAAFLAATAAPAFADDSYLPCTQPGQDHCRVVPHHGKAAKHHGGKHHHSAKVEKAVAKKK